MQFKDYYQILDAPRDADTAQIKTCYRKQARRYHPDISEEVDAEARIKEINEAYEVLKDPEKRAAYDRLGAGWRGDEEIKTPNNWNSPLNTARGFSEFFESLFGAFVPHNNHGYPVPGDDQHARILIALEDAYSGAVRSIELSMPGGERKTLRVRIPKGIFEGQRIRLAGQGDPGVFGAEAGDLYLEVEFKHHPLFRSEGRDLYLHLPVTPWEAALGAKISAPTLEGAVELTIEPGSQSGRRLRLRGRGLPGEPAGDLYVEVMIVIPEAADEDAKEFYLIMQETFPMNPRADLFEKLRRPQGTGH